VAGAVHDRPTSPLPGVAVRPVGPPGVPVAVAVAPLDGDAVACPLAEAEALAEADADALADGVADASPDLAPWSFAWLTAATVK